jgi:hypothetical protein
MTGGPYGAEHAVILPSQDGVMRMAANVLAMDEQRRAKEEQRKREEQERQDSLTMYLGKEFDEKNFATGTPSDRVINDSLRQMKQNYMGLIMKNPNMRLSELGYLIQGDVEKLNTYSVNAKTVRGMIDEATKGLDADKSVDAKAIRMGALNKAFFDIDPETNQMRLKEPDKIEMNRDYVNEFMQERPDLWVKGNAGIEDWVNNQKAEAAGDETTTDKGGIKKTRAWSANLRPFQEVMKDQDGNVTGIGIKHQLLEFPDGTNMEVLDDNMYQSLINSNRGAKGYLDSRIKKHPMFKGVDLNSPEADILRKRFAYEELSQNFNQGDAFKTKNIEDRSALRDKIDLLGIAKVMTGAGKPKEEKPNVIEALIRAKAGDPLIVDGMPGRNGMINITGRIPGATVYQGKTKSKRSQDGKAQLESYSEILYNPRDGEIYVVDENRPGAPPEKVGNFDKWIENIAEANGVPVKNVSGIRSKYKQMNASGEEEYIWMHDTPRDIMQEANAKKYSNTVLKEIDEFSKTKDVRVLKNSINDPVTLADGTTGKLANIKYKPARFWGDNMVEFTIDGEKKRLTDREFEKLLRDGTQ